MFLELHGFADNFGFCTGDSLYPAVVIERDTRYGEQWYSFMWLCVDVRLVLLGTFSFFEH